MSWRFAQLSYWPALYVGPVWASFNLINTLTISPSHWILIPFPYFIYSDKENQTGAARSSEAVDKEIRTQRHYILSFSWKQTKA